MKNIFIFSLILLLTSCATNLTAEHETGKAYLIEGHRFIHGNIIADIKFLELDGKNLKEMDMYPTRLNVASGKHKVLVYCTSYGDRFETRGEVLFDQEFKADKVYEFIIEFVSEQECTIELHEQV